jgi:hypothetical protein
MAPTLAGLLPDLESEKRLELVLPGRVYPRVVGSAGVVVLGAESGPHGYREFRHKTVASMARF